MKKFLSLIMCLALLCCFPMQTYAKTVTAKVDTTVDKMPQLKTGTTTVKLQAPSNRKSQKRSVLFEAPKTGTYKVSLSNVKIADTSKGGLTIFVYTGKESGMFFRYGYKDVKIQGVKVHQLCIPTKARYASLPKSGDDNVYQEVTRKNMKNAKQFYNPKFNIKLQKGECLLLEGYYVKSYEEDKGVNGKEVYKSASYKVKIREA